MNFNIDLFLKSDLSIIANYPVSCFFCGLKIDTSLYASEGYLLKGLAVVPYPTSEDKGKRSYVLLVSEIKQ